MKKRIFIIIISLLLFIGVVSVFLFNILKPAPLSSEDRDVLLLTDTHKTRILVYGDPLALNEKLYSERISELTSESIAFDESFEYEYIIISDKSGSLDMTLEDWLVLKELVHSDKRVSFTYLGTTQFQNMIKSQITELDESDLFREPSAVGGIYTDDVLYTEIGNALTPFEVIHNFAWALRQSKKVITEDSTH